MTLEAPASKPSSSTEISDENKYEFDGLIIEIHYRDKDGVNRLEDASKIAARLKSLGAIVKIQKNNYKDFGNTVFYGRSETAKIAAKIARRISDIAEVSPQKMGLLSGWKKDVFTIVLQIP
jgi:hypothetical protein